MDFEIDGTEYLAVELLNSDISGDDDSDFSDDEGEIPSEELGQRKAYHIGGKFQMGQSIVTKTLQNFKFIPESYKMPVDAFNRQVMTDLAKYPIPITETSAIKHIVRIMLHQALANHIMNSFIGGIVEGSNDEFKNELRKQMDYDEEYWDPDCFLKLRPDEPFHLVELGISKREDYLESKQVKFATVNFPKIFATIVWDEEETGMMKYRSTTDDSLFHRLLRQFSIGLIDIRKKCTEQGIKPYDGEGEEIYFESELNRFMRPEGVIDLDMRVPELIRLVDSKEAEINDLEPITKQTILGYIKKLETKIRDEHNKKNNTNMSFDEVKEETFKSFKFTTFVPVMGMPIKVNGRVQISTMPTDGKLSKTESQKLFLLEDFVSNFDFTNTNIRKVYLPGFQQVTGSNLKEIGTAMNKRMRDPDSIDEFQIPRPEKPPPNIKDIWKIDKAIELLCQNHGLDIEDYFLVEECADRSRAPVCEEYANKLKKFKETWIGLKLSALNEGMMRFTKHIGLKQGRETTNLRKGDGDNCWCVPIYFEGEYGKIIDGEAQKTPWFYIFCDSLAIQPGMGGTGVPCMIMANPIHEFHEDYMMFSDASGNEVGLRVAFIHSEVVNHYIFDNTTIAMSSTQYDFKPEIASWEFIKNIENRYVTEGLLGGIGLLFQSLSINDEGGQAYCMQADKLCDKVLKDMHKSSVGQAAIYGMLDSFD